MATEYILTEDGFRLLLEDSSGALILESSTNDIFSTFHRIHRGMVTVTATGLGGVLEE